MAKSIGLVQNGLRGRVRDAAGFLLRLRGPATVSRRARVGAGLSACAVLLAGLLYTISPHDRILQGVSVEGIAVGGLRPDAARTVLAQSVAPLLSDQIVLSAGGRTEAASIGTLGGTADWDRAVARAWSIGRAEALWHRWRARYTHACGQGADVAVPIRWQDDPLRAGLQRFGSRCRLEPVPAHLEFADDGSFQIAPEVSGLCLDEEAAVSVLRELAARPHVQQVELPMRTEPAQVTASDLAYVNCKLAEFSTSLSGSSRNRIHNVALGADALSGQTLLPGEVFSFNKIVGPRLVSAGFREAPVYERGKVVPGTGGGTCQVSTTLYNLALLTPCEVIERSSHSMPVHYVPLGRDATVAYDSIDLKFKNTGRYPIYIFARVANRRCYMAAYGNDADKIDVRLTSSVLSTQPAATVTVEDPSLPAGEKEVAVKGNNGYVASVIREVWKDDVRIEREVLHTDRYTKHDRVERVGVGGQPETPIETTE
jgi:vancomycin resistance protein YoaR